MRSHRDAPVTSLDSPQRQIATVFNHSEPTATEKLLVLIAQQQVETNDLLRDLIEQNGGAASVSGLLTVMDVAKHLGYKTTNPVYDVMRSKKDPLPYSVVGAKRRVKLTDLNAWVERRRVS